MYRTLSVVALAGSIALSGCISNNPNASHTTEGAVSGGLIGAAIGALARPHHAGRGALIGGAIGVITGALIGASADQRQEYYRRHLHRHAVYVERHGDHVVLIMPTDRLFAPGSADLRPRGARVIADVAANLREEGPGTVKVYGYTAQGSPDENRQLSQARAEAVAGALEENGVDHARITAQGLGGAHPRLPAPDDPRNSRVEIVIEPANS